MEPFPGGLVFTPVFYYVIMWFGGSGKAEENVDSAAQDGPADASPAESGAAD